MKPLPMIVMQVLLVVAGLVIYDQVRGGGGGDGSGADLSGADLGGAGGIEGGASGGAPQPFAGAAAGRPPILAGAGVQAEIYRNRDEIAQLKEMITTWTKHVGSMKRAQEEQSALGVEGTASDDPVVLEETKLNTLRAYMEEIGRRQRQERRSLIIEKTLRNAGVDMEPAALKDVAREFINFQDQAQELVRASGDGLTNALQSQKAAFEQLREEFHARIRQQLPREDAERILSTRLAQTAGMFSPPQPGKAPPK